MIDILKIKLNPLVLGGGTRLFGNSQKACRLKISSLQSFLNGLQIITYNVDYSWEGGV